jgi:hypothetical protein
LVIIMQRFGDHPCRIDLHIALVCQPLLNLLIHIHKVYQQILENY